MGLYGTVAFNVARRTNEIGVRMTLGASRRHIVWIVLRDINGCPPLAGIRRRDSQGF